MEPLLRDFFEHDNNDQNPLIKRIFGSYEDFETKLKTVFGEINKKRTTEKQLAKFKQTGSALHYTAQFRQIILQLHWENNTFITKFYKSLKEHIKDEITKKDRPEELTKYIERTVRINNRLYKRQQKRQRTTPSLQ